VSALVAEYERSRRELIRRGIALGGAVVAAGAVPFLMRVRSAFAQADGDAAVLRAAVAFEQDAVLAYTTAADGGRLGRHAPLARLLAEQEQEHADGLIAALRGLGGTPPAPPSEVPGLAEAVAGDTDAFVGFAIELETMAVAAYHDAQGKLSAPELLSTTASIMASEAQHLVVLRRAGGRDPAPEAFVTG
jgi:rubrerythrin